jgi:multicomponent Na+:H+ antiporter subunit G
MNDLVTAVFMVIGGIFMLLAAVGILRLPDTYTRLQASTKAATLGVSSILLGAAFHFADLGVTIRAVTTILFLLATAPVAGHLIARVAYLLRVPLWEQSRYDELRPHFDDAASPPPAHTRRADTRAGDPGAS